MYNELPACIYSGMGTRSGLIMYLSSFSPPTPMWTNKEYNEGIKFITKGGDNLMEKEIRTTSSLQGGELHLIFNQIPSSYLHGEKI